MIVEEFVAEVQRIYATGQSTEHSYRAALGQLFDSIDKGNIVAINEPTAGTSGRPDFVFLRNVGAGAQITVGHCEAKDIGIDIDKRALKDANKRQWERYTKGLPNLIYTNGLEWHFYKNGDLVRDIRIADYSVGIAPLPENYESLANQLKDFAAERLQTVSSPERLAKLMAGKAAITKDVLFNALRADEDLTSELAGQYKAFKEQLIHDLQIEDFADIYAETVAYGMFAARLHDDTKEDFTREEALRLLPKSNPFLRKLFEFIAGPSLDDALRRTVDELAEIFQATDLQKLFANFGSFTARNDPFIHFYETFLAEYNPKKRKARGVWYTPEPVVNFIVRAVDDVLKEEFGLADGLADTSKITVDWDTGQQDQKGKPVIEKREVHRVQILDPAAGTGTFLAEVIRQIAPRIQQVGGSVWNRYVEENLIPRLHGFELLMASYAMCHMKLDMMLTEMGYRPTKEPPRLNVYLTNTLEEPSPERQDLFMARWLSHEAQLADDVKKNVPIMCIIGNPPYAISSSNNGPSIRKLLKTYKEGLGRDENVSPVSDDYVKFLRFAHSMIEKTGCGIVAFITNNSYLSGVVFRSMRENLLSTFDSIHVLDLNGGDKRSLVSDLDEADTNVFDIRQGVAIVVLVRGGKAVQIDKNTLHYSLIGGRVTKNTCLYDLKLDAPQFKTIEPVAPYYLLNGSDLSGVETYDAGFALNQFFQLNASGIKFRKDPLLISPHYDRESVQTMMIDMNRLSSSEILSKYNFKETKDWKVEEQRENFDDTDSAAIRAVDYRVFDRRYTYYPFDKISKIIPRGDSRRALMTHLVEANLSLLVKRGRLIGGSTAFHHVAVAADMVDLNYLADQTYCLPLYLYPDDTAEQTDALAPTERTVNMDPDIRARIEAAAMGSASHLRGEEPAPDVIRGGPARSAGSDEGPAGAPDAPHPPFGHPLPASGEKGDAAAIEPSRDADGRPNEVAIFDYVYGVLHCPAYRETYAEFLKIDFPRIPYPPSPEVFWEVSEKGTQLRRLHLMEDAAIGDTPYPFEGEAEEGEDSVVGKVVFEPTGDDVGAVFINVKGKTPSGQHFANVPKIAWEFFIGGYQPAQKWLKDRKGRELSFDDIRHYQKIIKILAETDRIMKTIDMPLGEGDPA